MVPLHQITLKVLATTDLHGQLLPYDYIQNRAADMSSLSHLAVLIKQARADHPNILLLDNGDFSQGSALVDLASEDMFSKQRPHPIMQAMNALNFDAATLGNHEFDHGLEVLRAIISQAEFPIISANIRHRTTGELVPPSVILERRLFDTNDQPHTIRIGLIGVLPQKTDTWTSLQLNGALICEDMVSATKREARHLRSNGADIIILLAHCGIESPNTNDRENAGLALSELPEIDAMVLGHTHERIPGPDHQEHIDPISGTRQGLPIVMPGFNGSDLGVIDLLLEMGPMGWRIASCHTQLQQSKISDPIFADTLSAAHQKTITKLDENLGFAQMPYQTYTSALGPNSAVDLLANAQMHALRACVDTTQIPILSAASAFRAGGRAGPYEYVDIPIGDLSLRHVAGFYPFPNLLFGLQLTGAELRDWLERAVSGYAQISEGLKEQPLISSNFANHHFDKILGVSYQIDLSQPARFDHLGTMVNPDAYRISHLRHNGRELEDRSPFIVAANSYRLTGSGPYEEYSGKQDLIYTDLTIREAVIDYIQSNAHNTDFQSSDWGFVSIQNTSVKIETGPGLRQHPDEIAKFNLRDLGNNIKGFAQFEMAL